MKTTEKIETTADGFRKLNQDIIFIAGSQDIKPLRSAVEWAIRNTIHRLAPGSGLKPFSWDIETSDKGFDQTKSMQKCLPRPSDERCLGLVCLMAERIGHPLEDTFDKQIINDIEVWTEPDHNYQLVHPWPHDREEQVCLIERGCYPLTGTVFEFIDAYSTSKIVNTPVRFYVVASEPINPNSNNKSVRLGKRIFWEAKSPDPDDDNFDVWKKYDYGLQTAAVKNFVCALTKLGISQYTFDNYEKIIENVKPFVAREIVKSNFQNINPYKFLNYFDVYDVEYFFGRENETKRATQDLWDRFDSPSCHNVIRIVGYSGAGKSSFLCAGFIAKFQDPEYRGEVRTVVIHPIDFQKADGTPLELIRSILDFVEQQTDILIPPGQKAEVCKRGLQAPRLAIELLQNLLPKATDGKKSKLVFGFNQFEEIVDYLSDKQKMSFWYPIIKFIDIAGRSEAIGVAYTLETSRKKSLKLLDLPAVFNEIDEIEIDGYTSEFIHSIIEGPFKKARYPLSREVVKKIKDNIQSLKPKDGPRIENSILPLIALKLSKLFDYIQENREPITVTDLVETTGVAFDENATHDPSCVQLDDVKDKLEFGELIETEAKKAWQEARKTTHVNPKEIDFFLQPFIGVGGPNLDQLQLQIAKYPLYPTEQKLVESFKDHKLLIPTSHGLKLVHEAVIHNWKEAQECFENKQGLLKKEVVFRRKASEWIDTDCSTNANTITEQDIDGAAEILSAYLRVWGTDKTDSLSDEDKLLRDYCLMIFRYSKTPSKTIQYIGKETGRHVFRAAQYGMNDLLEKFYKIDHKCLELTNPNTKKTPLVGAAYYHLETVKFLLKKGADPVTKDNLDWPPIAAPIIMDRMDIFTELLTASNGAGLDGPKNSTMLHLCAQEGRLEMAQMLVNLYKLQPDQPDEYQRRPFHTAAFSGKLETFKYFVKLSNIADVTIGDYTALHLSASNGHTAIVDYLLNEPLFFQYLNARTKKGETALHLASINRKWEVVDLLLQAFNPNQEIEESKDTCYLNMCPLHLAITKRVDGLNDPDAIFSTVSVLLEDSRTDPNVVDNKGKTPIALASYLPKVQKLLLRHYNFDPTKPISTEGEMPLTLCAKLKDWEAFRILEKRHATFQSGSVDKTESTFLHLLIEKHAPRDIIDNTLSSMSNTDLNTLNKNGHAPVLIAILERNWELVRKLVRYDGIDPTCRGSNSKSTLVLALESKVDEDTLGYLIKEAPTLLTETDYFGWTPLHRAIASQRIDWVELLLAQSQNSKELWEQQDFLGRCPADLASPTFKDTIPHDEKIGSRPCSKSWNSDLMWEPLEDESRAELKKRIDIIDKRYVINDDTDIQTTTLPFYDFEAVKMIRIRSDSWDCNDLNIYYLEHNDNLYRLNGTSPPIRKVNREANIHLNVENVLSYLRFFCFFVRSDGPFLIAEHSDQGEIPSLLAENERKELDKILFPTFYNGYNEEKSKFLAFAAVYYSNEIFVADFAIQKTGMVDMIDDQLVMKGLTAKIYEPLGYNDIYEE